MLKSQRVNGIISLLVEKSTSGGDDFGRGTLPNNRTLFYRVLLSRTIAYDARGGGYRGVKNERPL